MILNIKQKYLSMNGSFKGDSFCDDEIVADVAKKINGNYSQMLKVLDEHPTFGKQLGDKMIELYQNIRGANKSGRDNIFDNAEAQTIEKAAKLWTKAMREKGIGMAIGVDNIDGEVYNVSDDGEMNNVMYSQSAMWYPDLSKSRLNELNAEIKREVIKSPNVITDKANWIYTNIGGTNVFAIYSTENVDEPTLLYESKGKQASIEKQILEEILEVGTNGENLNGGTSFVDRVSKGNWMQHGNSVANRSDGMLGRNGSVGNAAVLQRKSSTYGSSAFRNVIENLFEIQSRILEEGLSIENRRYSMDYSESADDGKKVSKVYDNSIMGKDTYKVIQNAAEARMAEFMYDGISNKETYEAAQKRIDGIGVDKATQKVLAKVASAEAWTADDTASALALMAHHQTKSRVPLPLGNLNIKIIPQKIKL